MPALEVAGTVPALAEVNVELADQRSARHLDLVLRRRTGRCTKGYLGGFLMETHR
jgi:hypothetical protein